MSVIGEAFVRVRPDSTGFSEGVSSGVSGGLKSFALGASALIGGIFAGKEVLDGLKTLNDAFQEAARTDRLTAAVLASTGGAANVTATQLGNLAKAQSELTGVDRASIQSAGNVLLTFRDVRNEAGKNNDIFTQGVVAAQNLSSAFGKDLQGSIILVGKALNDPTKGLSALSRVGVTFTAQQKDQIKALQASGDLLGAQKLILAEFSKEFGGAAAAAADPIARLKASFVDFKETLGAQVGPLFNQIATGLQGVLPQLADVLGKALGAIIPAILPIVQQIAPLLGVIVTALAPIVTGLGAALGSVLGSVATALAPIIQALLPSIVSIGQAIGSIGAALGPVFAAFAPLLGPIVTLVSGFAQVLAAVLVPILTVLAQVLTPIISQLSDQLTGALVGIIPIVTAFASTLGGDFAIVLKAIIPVLGKLAEGILPILLQVFESLAPVFTSAAGAIGQLLTAAAPLLPLLGGALLSVLKAVAPAFIAIEKALQGTIVKLLLALVPIVSQLVKALVPLAPVFGQIAGILANVLTKALVTLQPFLGQFVKIFAGELSSVIKQLSPQIPVLAKAFLEIATSFGKILISLLPLVPPLLQLATLLIEKISVPVMIEQAKAYALLANAIAPVATAVADILAAGIKDLVGFILDLGTALGNFDFGSIVTFFDGIAPAVESGLSSLGNAIATLATNFVSSFISGVGGLAGQFLTFLAGVPKAIGLGVFALAQTGADIASNFISAVVSGVGGIAGAIASAFTDLPLKLAKAGFNAITSLVGVAQAIIAGLVHGIIDKAGDVLSALKKFVLDKIPGFIKDFFHISSPSKMFQGFGQNLMEGFALGIGNSAGLVLGQIADVARQVSTLPPIAPPRLGPFTPASAAAASVGGTQAAQAAQVAAGVAAGGVGGAVQAIPVGLDTAGLAKALGDSVTQALSGATLGGVHIDTLTVPAEQSPTQTGFEIARRLRTESFLAGK